MSHASNSRLVVCAGECVDHLCATAIDRLSTDSVRDRFCIVLSDWLPPDLFATAGLLWVVTSSAPTQQIVRALENRIPLLVPGANLQLKLLCVNANCGLYYRDVAEAFECLKFFSERDDLRLSMGANGRRYLEGNPQSAYRNYTRSTVQCPVKII